MDHLQEAAYRRRPRRLLGLTKSYSDSKGGERGVSESPVPLTSRLGFYEESLNSNYV